MTNNEHWNNYCSGLSSPENFIQWGFLYTIGASLQRRVWIGSGEDECFPNSYVILVGEPGIGKGLVLKRVSACLRHWSLKDALILDHNAKSETDKAMAKAVIEKDTQDAQKNEQQTSSPQAPLIDPLLIPIAPDDITYESLTRSTAQAYRRHNYINEEGKMKPYGHSSIAFVLPEFSSLMKKHSENTVNYLLGLYDCPKDFEYKTKNSGQDRVRRGCINLIAGTTPGFMQETFSDRLLSEGFTSRTFYIFANKNRKNQAFIPSLTAEQKESQKVILEHIRKLTTLYGPVQIDKETIDWIEAWWDKDNNERHNRANRSLKMVPYYSRKNIHMFKVAMQKHFMESLEMRIPLSCFQWAASYLHEEEKNMHFAITMTETNPLAKVANRVLAFLKSGKKNWVDLVGETYGIAKKSELEEALTMLQETNQVVVRAEEEEGEDNKVNYWRLKE